MHFFLPTVVLLALASGFAAQCIGNDHPNCRGWKNNGYCTNTAQAMDVRKKYCGVICGFCNTDGSQTSAGGGSTLTECADANANCATWVKEKNFCTNTTYSNAIKLQYCCKTCRPVIFPTAATDGNANCDKWAKNTTTAFCSSDKITTDQKTLFCAKTCAFELKPTNDCAIYTVTGTELTRGAPSNKTAAPGTAVKSGATADKKTTLARVFAGTGCKVTLFPDEKPTDTSTGGFLLGPGTDAKHFFDVPAANNGSLSYTCTCA